MQRKAHDGDRHALRSSPSVPRPQLSQNTVLGTKNDERGSGVKSQEQRAKCQPRCPGRSSRDAGTEEPGTKSETPCAVIMTTLCSVTLVSSTARFRPHSGHAGPPEAAVGNRESGRSNGLGTGRSRRQRRTFLPVPNTPHKITWESRRRNSCAYLARRPSGAGAYSSNASRQASSSLNFAPSASRRSSSSAGSFSYSSAWRRWRTRALFGWRGACFEANTRSAQPASFAAFTALSANAAHRPRWSR